MDAFSDNMDPRRKQMTIFLLLFFFYLACLLAIKNFTFSNLIINHKKVVPMVYLFLEENYYD